MIHESNLGEVKPLDMWKQSRTVLRFSIGEAVTPAKTIPIDDVDIIVDAIVRQGSRGYCSSHVVDS